MKACVRQEITGNHHCKQHFYCILTSKVSCIRINSQSSTCHQCFYIISVDIQGFVVFVHGFHMTTMFEVIHTCTDTDGTKTDKERGNWVYMKVKSEEARGGKTR